MKEDASNRAVYVGFSKKSSVKTFSSIDKKLTDRLLCVTVGSDDAAISDAEFLLAPK